MIRLAGHGRRKDGMTVTWTVAEGRRGRRWREVVSDGAHVRWSLLYETDPDRGFSHLELAVADGLATLHPEGDGTLHGNVVDPAGLRHVVGEPYVPGTPLLVRGSSIAGAAVAWALAGQSGGAPPPTAVVLDPSTLTLAVAPLRPDDLPAVDGRGIPILATGREWPLEDRG